MKKITLSVLVVGLNFSTLFSQTIPSYVPTNGLVGWWPFNGNANDESGNGLNGTVNGGNLDSDRFGSSNKAYNFSGNGQGIIFPSPNAGTYADSIMVYSLWFKEIDNPSTEFLHIFKASGKSLMLNVPIGELRAYDGNSFHVAAISNLFQQNGWKHVVVSYDHQIISIYINGVLVTSQTTGFNFPIQFESIECEVGMSSGGQYPYAGLIDDVAIWNRSLSQTEINELYNGSSSGIDQIQPFEQKKILYIFDLNGKIAKPQKNTFLLYQYIDGTIEKVYILE